VLVILVLLLGDFRSSIITGRRNNRFACGSIHPDVVLRLSANLMSLGGLASVSHDGLTQRWDGRKHLIAIYEEHREHSIREAILVAAQGNRAADVLAILIIIAVFLPVFTLQGIEGKLFKARWLMRSPSR